MESLEDGLYEEERPKSQKYYAGNGQMHVVDFNEIYDGSVRSDSVPEQEEEKFELGGHQPTN